MTIYVIETIKDGVVQHGWTLDRNRAEFECEELNKLWGEDKYWVEEYSIEKPSDFCEFD